MGLYPVLALCNHSCWPNCAVMFEGRVASLRALRPIRKGEELSISYIELALPTSERRRMLQDGYCFHCQCSRCCADR